MKKTLSFLALAIALSASAQAQDLSAPAQDPLADLPPIGMALEVAKLCGTKESQFPELVKFKRLARESYVKLRGGDPADIDAAFKRGAEQGRKLKPDMTPEKCKSAMVEMKKLDEVFKATNGTIEQLMQMMAASAAKPAPKR